MLHVFYQVFEMVWSCLEFRPDWSMHGCNKECGKKGRVDSRELENAKTKNNTSRKVVKNDMSI